MSYSEMEAITAHLWMTFSSRGFPSFVQLEKEKSEKDKKS